VEKAAKSMVMGNSLWITLCILWVEQAFALKEELLLKESIIFRSFYGYIKTWHELL